MSCWCVKTCETFRCVATSLSVRRWRFSGRKITGTAGGTGSIPGCPFSNPLKYMSIAAWVLEARTRQPRWGWKAPVKNGMAGLPNPEGHVGFQVPCSTPWTTELNRQWRVESRQSTTLCQRGIAACNSWSGPRSFGYRRRSSSLPLLMVRRISPNAYALISQPITMYHFCSNIALRRDSIQKRSDISKYRLGFKWLESRYLSDCLKQLIHFWLENGLYYKKIKHRFFSCL